MSKTPEERPLRLASEHPNPRQTKTLRLESTTILPLSIFKSSYKLPFATHTKIDHHPVTSLSSRMSQAEFKKRLKALMIKPENHICSDCPERQPRWASLIVPPPGSPPGSLAMGAFCCLECSGSHRRLGVHISFVRSITLDSCKSIGIIYCT